MERIVSVGHPVRPENCGVGFFRGHQPTVAPSCCVATIAAMTLESLTPVIASGATLFAVGVALWSNLRTTKLQEAAMALQTRRDIALEVVDWAGEMGDAAQHWTHDLSEETERDNRFNELCVDRYFGLEQRVRFAFGTASEIAESLAAVRDGLDRLRILAWRRDQAFESGLTTELRLAYGPMEAGCTQHFEPVRVQLIERLAVACHLAPVPPSSPRVIEPVPITPAHP